MLLPLFYIIFVSAFAGISLAAIGDGCRSQEGTGICRLNSDCTGGFTVIGACPNDPTNILCCINTKCTIDNLAGNCKDKSRLACKNGFYTPGYCPGNNDVQCCVENNFVEYLHTVYDRATEYTKAHSGSPPESQLVMEWLRHKAYNGVQWNELIGHINEGWLKYAEGKGLAMFPTFSDSFFKGIEVETDHLTATMNGVYLLGNGLRGDISGWGGDLITFYAEWRVSGIPADEFCRKNLAKQDVASTFKLLDLIEDADGYNIATLLRNDKNAKIYDVVANYYKPGGGYKSRFSKFLASRFGNSSEMALQAYLILTSTDDSIVTAGRVWLIEKVAWEKGWLPVKLPGMIPSSELEGFCKAFAAVIDELAKK